MNRRLIAALTVALLAAGAAHASKPGFSKDLETLAAWFEGSFRENDGDAVLHVVPVWTDRIDARWFYAEESRGADAVPARQAVLRLMENEQGSFECAEFGLSAPARFAGAWKSPATLSALPGDSLVARPGCSLFLQRRKDGSYSGKARSPSCLSVLRASPDEISELRVDAKGITAKGWAGAAPGAGFTGTNAPAPPTTSLVRTRN